MPKILWLIAILLIAKVSTYDCAQLADGTLGGQKCAAQGGECVNLFEGILDRPICVWYKGCRFSKERKGCIDVFNVCSRKGGCCLPVAQQADTGLPICKCIDSIAPRLCPNCLAEVNSDTCTDQNRICTARGGCCKLNHWGSPSEGIFWQVCRCERRDENRICQNCVFDKEKAACVDLNGQCSKAGKCCQAQIGQFSPITGLPVCKCVQARWCPQCQRKEQGGQCFDPTRTCYRDKLCCGLDRFANGVQLCHCHGCPPNQNLCKYDSQSRTCKGQCEGKNQCCQFSGKFKLNDQLGISQPVCRCKERDPTVFDQCQNSCQWNKRLGKCLDLTGKCDNQLDKCCKLDASGTLCGCRDCQDPKQQCKYNYQTQKCDDLCCPDDGKHRCTRIISSDGIIKCQCLEILIGVPIYEGRIDLPDTTDPIKSPSQQKRGADGKNLLTNPFGP